MNKPDLYVDLDGTLLRGDSLHEGCVRLVRKPSRWLAALKALLGGKAAFKAAVFEAAGPAVDELPYRKDFLDWLKSEKKSGRKLFLATGADSVLASAVVGRLGIFDGCLASRDGVNLTGAVKLSAIKAQAGGAAFSYAGNDSIDYPIFESAESVVLVGHAAISWQRPSGKKVEAVFSSTENSWRSVARQIRPYQWAKNALIFLPAIAAHRFLEPAVFSADLLLFAAFSLCASGVYAANDLLDLANDRSHAYKQHRPLASGEVTIPSGLLLAGLLPLAALGLAWIAAGWPGLAMLAGYWAVTTYYSVHGKRVPLLDVFLLAGLYTFRAYAGALTVPAGMSGWMAAFLLFLFFGLACMKRFSELLALSQDHEGTVSGRGYRRSDHQLMAMLGIGAAFSAALVICLYATSSAVQPLYHEPLRLMALAPLVLLGLGRLWFQAWRGQLHADPVLHALKDWASYLLLALCALVMFSATRA